MCESAHVGALGGKDGGQRGVCVCGGGGSNTNDSFIDVVVKQWFTVRVGLLNVLPARHCGGHKTTLSHFKYETVSWYLHLL